jgi:pilus assembly protein TadC
MKDKDALDVLRILRAVPSEVLKEVLNRLRHDDLAGTVTHEALDYLRTLFGSRAGLGTQMAVRATERLADPETIAASCEALATDLLQELAGTTR